MNSYTQAKARANKTGKALEDFVENALNECGHTLPSDNKLFANRGTVTEKQYAKHCLVGQTIYGARRYVDFLIVNKNKFPEDLIIECKWQQSGGSVDEKYPFLRDNIIHTGVPTIILLDGGGYSDRAKKWLEGQAGKERVLRAVWSMSDFRREVNNGFLG